MKISIVAATSSFGLWAALGILITLVCCSPQGESSVSNPVPTESETQPPTNPEDGPKASKETRSKSQKKTITQKKNRPQRPDRPDSSDDSSGSDSCDKPDSPGASSTSFGGFEPLSEATTLDTGHPDSRPDVLSNLSEDTDGSRGLEAKKGPSTSEFSNSDQPPIVNEAGAEEKLPTQSPLPAKTAQDLALEALARDNPKTDRHTLKAKLTGNLESKIKSATVVIESHSLKELGSSYGSGSVYTQTLGTLISPRWVLTCAHYNRFHLNGRVTIEGERIAIENVYPYPKWVQGDKTLDFALIRLASEAKSAVSPLEISEFNVTPENFQEGYIASFVHNNLDQVYAKPGKEYGTFEKQIGEVYKLLISARSNFADNYFRSAGLAGLGLSLVFTNLADHSTANFSLRKGDSGGGLFTSQQNLIGVASMAGQEGSTDFTTNDGRTGRLKFNLNLWSIISQDVANWIRSYTQPSTMSLNKTR